MVLKDIDYLHFSKSQSEFDARNIIISNKWYQFPSLIDFKDYFIDKWIDNSMQHCTNWQIYLTPPG